MTSTGYVRNFNLRSHEGSDTVALETLNSYLNFNPRSHEGSDDTDSSKAVGADIISIHAPTRGATADILKAIEDKLFQSTLPRGERPAIDPQLNSQYRFQSTLPRGERPDLTSGGTW